MVNADLLENTKSVFRRISHAAMRAGREPDSVRVVAVSKTVEAETVLQAVEIGLRDFGENRVQEAKEKIAYLSPLIPEARVIWHCIGHLQKNKAKTAVALFDIIHSVDSPELAGIVDRHARDAGKVQRILLQAKLSDEEAKHGMSEDALLSLLGSLRTLKHVRAEGLMTMPPYFEDPELTRPYFRHLRELRDLAEKKGFHLPELSMGMSHDFEVAIEEGATIVRIGTALFGERIKSGP